MRAISVTATVSLMLLALSAALGVLAYQLDQERSGLYRHQQDIGLKFGCSDEYPIPASAPATVPDPDFVPDQRATRATEVGDPRLVDDPRLVPDPEDLSGLDLEGYEPPPQPPGQSICYRRDACDFWGHPSCKGFTLHPGFVTAWEALEERRSSLEIRQFTFAAIAGLLGYVLVGWHLHSLIVALLLRFMLPKWALLMALIVDLMTANAVGGIRAIVGLLKLPPRHVGENEAPAA